MKINIPCILLSILCISQSIGQISYPGNPPGTAKHKSLTKDSFVLSNDIIGVSFSNTKNGIRLNSFEDKITKKIVRLKEAPLFVIELSDGSLLNSDLFTLSKPLRILPIVSDPSSVSHANRIPGVKYEAEFENRSLGLNVLWQAQLRDGSNYFQNIFTFSSRDTVQISHITLIKFPIKNEIEKDGLTDGVPLIDENMFFAIESPLSKIDREDENVVVKLPRLTPLTSQKPLVVSSVWGSTPVNQLRRGFLYYLERERAVPYRQMSFYNSFGDIAFFDRKMSERACIERIRWIGDSLIKKRNVKLSAFLFDDGWDNNESLWRFHAGFPEGFSNMRTIADSYGSSLGVWISPYGGFREPKRLRIKFGESQNPPFETNKHGFSLAGPVYYNRYREVVTDFINKYGISILKFDGVAGKDQREMEAYLEMVKDIRKVKSDMHFCLTSGTYPSPFFLKYGDAVWRGGEDWSIAGEGSNRQKWITYRDSEVYKTIVHKSPLYPISALQLMGIFVCDISDKKYHGLPGVLEMDEKDLSDDIWMGIGSGTSVQGLYINAYRMNTPTWDCLAAALNWAKSNEGIMPDTHWLGGNPEKGEIYGYASWSEDKALLTIRNPSSTAKTFDLDVKRIWEIPNGLENEYLFYDVKKDKSDYKNLPILEGDRFMVNMEPYEVKVLEAYPKGK